MRTMLFRAGLAVALAGVLAACGSSGGSKAEPILAPSTSTPATARSHTTTKPSATTTPASGTKATPSSADLDALTQFLDSAGSELNDSSASISSADVNTAKNQEGSVP